MRRRVLCSALGAALLAGCARVPAPVEPRQAASQPPAPAEPAPASPAAYVARAASYDQLMIRAGEAVSTRARTPELLQLASHLSADHHGLAAQLSMAGRRLDLLPKPQLLPQHQLWLDEMLSAPDPAPAYRRLARRVHQNSYAMHARFAEKGDSPTLKLIARNAADTERRHWSELTR